MPANLNPIYTRVGQVDGGTILTTAANDYTGQSINNIPVFQADLDNGGFVQRLRFKAVGTNVVTVARIYINNGRLVTATSLSAVSGTPTGTPSASGGTLPSGNYYAKIQAIDAWGGRTAMSTETAAISVTGPTGSISYSWSAVTGAASYRIFVGNVTNGQFCYFESTTNSYTQSVPYIAGQTEYPLEVLNNNMFYGEITLPATTASVTQATVDIDFPMNIPLPPGYRIVVGLATTVAAGWQVSVIGGSY